MAFGNFWRGGGRERFGGERDEDRSRDRWRTTGSDWRDDERDRWRENQRSGSWERDRDDYSGREGGSREGRYGSSEWESGEDYGRRQGYGRQGYGQGQGHGQGQGYGQSQGGERYRSQGSGSESGRGWGSEERQSDYPSTRYSGSEYDYRGGGSYGTAGSYESPQQGMHRGRGPRNYRRSDERIREDVCDCLTEDARIDASNIEVAVKECEVTLNGTVFQREDKRRAEDLAERISGVKDVRNNLRVSLQQGGSPSQAGEQGQPGQQGQTGQSPRH